MRLGKVDRVKRQLLTEAVADNLDTIRGLPPRSLRPARRASRVWLRRAPLLLVPAVLLGSTYFAGSRSLEVSGSRSETVRAQVVPAFTSKPRGPETPRPLAQPLVRVSASAFPLAVHRIVLDAGHGGRDAGTTATDITEKDITLDIETRLRALLLRHGFEVVTTRADDRLIALRERARLANSSSGDIFLSIHVNSLQTHVDSHGIETYYLGPTNDPSLTKLAAAENLASGYSIADMRKLLDRVYADVRRDESHQLASSVQQQLFAGLRAVDPGLENWGVKRAPFIVLTATEMPAILAEVGCLSNQVEAEMLRNPTYRQQIAQALFNGIQAYANENAEGRKQKAEG
jgi:N-acetylmuramoyl-L-alanine amidase